MHKSEDRRQGKRPGPGRSRGGYSFDSRKKRGVADFCLLRLLSFVRSGAEQVSLSAPSTIRLLQNAAFGARAVPEVRDSSPESIEAFLPIEGKRPGGTVGVPPGTPLSSR